MKRFEEYNFKGKKALVRVDFNVPLNDKLEITDDTRIRAAIPTIKKILNDGGAVILMSHLGRPKGEVQEKFSLKNIKERIEELLGLPIQFTQDSIGEKTQQKANELRNGEVLLLENLRFHKEEKAGDKAFAKQLSKLADVYVNDAFGTAHRAHASTAIIAEYFPENKLFGFVIENELENISKLLNNPKHPFTAIMGGAKVSTKITIIEKLLPKIDHLIIGGAMVYTFIKARGGKVGDSLVEENQLDLPKQILKAAKKYNVEIHLPIDTAIGDSFSADAKKEFCKVDEIPNGWMGLDIGPESIKIIKEIISNSGTILWNGPAGVFEFEQFSQGTEAILEALAEATEKGAFTLVGGGDSVAAINKYNKVNKVSYVSTGGGALLEYMEGKELPGIKAIKEKK